MSRYVANKDRTHQQFRKQRHVALLTSTCPNSRANIGTSFANAGTSRRTSILRLGLRRHSRPWTTLPSTSILMKRGEVEGKMLSFPHAVRIVLIPTLTGYLVCLSGVGLRYVNVNQNNVVLTKP